MTPLSSQQSVLQNCLLRLKILAPPTQYGQDSNDAADVMVARFSR